MKKIWRSSNWLPCRIFFKTAELIKELSVTSVRPRSSSSLSQTAPSNATVSSGTLVAENISVLRQKELDYCCVREQHRLSNLELQRAPCIGGRFGLPRCIICLSNISDKTLLSFSPCDLPDTNVPQPRATVFRRQVDKVSRHQRVINGLYK